MTDTSTEEVFWVVWNPAFGSPRYRHENENAAKEESERLAQQNLGQKFYVLRGVGVALVEKPTVYKKLDDGISF